MESFYKLYNKKMLFLKNDLINLKNDINLTISDRSSVIINNLVNHNVYVHKGSSSRKIFLIKTHVGFKFGEFAFTRKPFKFPIKNKKKKNFTRR